MAGGCEPHQIPPLEMFEVGDSLQYGGCQRKRKFNMWRLRWDAVTAFLRRVAADNSPF